MEGNDITRDVYERLGEIKGQLSGLERIRETADNAEKKADEALLSTKSAHLRIDKFDKIMYWLLTSIGGVILVAILSLVLKQN